MEEIREETPAQRPLILIVDDTPTNIKLLAGVLSNEYEVAIATDGEQALQMAATTPPDLILLDVMMPGMDGFEVCSRLKKMPDSRTIPVIFLTAMAESADIVRGFDVGGVDYVTKPFRTPELLARVRTHVQLNRLKSLLSMCSFCNRIRDEGKWHNVDSYIRRKTGTSFSHGICPTCLAKMETELASPKP